VANYLSSDTKVSIGATATAGAAAATAINGAGLNMAGWDGVLVVVPFGTIVTNAVTSIKMQQSSDDAAADDYSDIVGTSQTVADDSDDKTFYIDLQRPTKQYVRVVVSRATQNATVGGVTYIQYRGRKKSQSHGSNVSGEQHFGAAEGTA
jgi:hypothetical protein